MTLEQFTQREITKAGKRIDKFRDQELTKTAVRIKEYAKYLSELEEIEMIRKEIERRKR